MLDFKPSMMHFLFTLRLRKAMPIINLKEHYPTAHPKDFFVEVSDEVHQFLLSMKRKEDAFARQVSRYHAYHSLDDPAFSVVSSCAHSNTCGDHRTATASCEHQPYNFSFVSKTSKAVLRLLLLWDFHAKHSRKRGHNSRKCLGKY